MRRFGFPRVRGHLRVTVALLVDAVGTGLFLPFSVLFFLATTDLALAQIGLAVSLGAVVRLAAGPAAGVMSDRIGPQRVLVVANLLQGAGYLTYPDGSGPTRAGHGHRAGPSRQCGVLVVVLATGDRDVGPR